MAKKKIETKKKFALETMIISIRLSVVFSIFFFPFSLVCVEIHSNFLFIVRQHDCFPVRPLNTRRKYNLFSNLPSQQKVCAKNEKCFLVCFSIDWNAVNRCYLYLLVVHTGTSTYTFKLYMLRLTLECCGLLKPRILHQPCCFAPATLLLCQPQPPSHHRCPHATVGIHLFQPDRRQRRPTHTVA